MKNKKYDEVNRRNRQDAIQIRLYRGVHRSPVHQGYLKILKMKQRKILADWFAHVFGEDGREYFHRVGSFYPDYTAGETDDQYNKCLRSGYKNGLDCFFKLCADAGIRYKTLEALTPEYWKQ